MKLALIGRNVEKSYSKLIHEYFIDCTYDLISVDEKSFATKLGEIIDSYDGFNVTMPYKEMILPYLDSASDLVKKIKSCNTVKVVNGKLQGYSTDGEGFMRSLGGICPADKNVLIIGSGGAAKCIAYSLSVGGAKLTITNRTLASSFALAESLGITAKILEKSQCVKNKCDMIVNCTSVGMFDDEMCFPLTHENAPNFAVDIIYKKTPFLKRAESLNIQTLSGMEMLVYQALAADKIFTGNEVGKDAQPLLKYLKEQEG